MSRRPDDERPKTSQWLIRLRGEAGFTNAKAFLADVKKTQGEAPSYSTYAQWESGEVTPRTVTLAPIVRYHAAREAAAMPATPPEPPEDQVVAAIDRQTAAIGKLTSQIEALLASRDKDLVALATAVGRALQGREALDTTPAA